jgi:hypothetical protein
MLVAMSAADVDHLLGQLQPLGLVPGEDIAVADMMDGPLLECPGVAFVNVGPAFPAQWMVNADEGPCPQPAGRHETA